MSLNSFFCWYFFYRLFILDGFVKMHANTLIFGYWSVDSKNNPKAKYVDKFWSIVLGYKRWGKEILFLYIFSLSQEASNSKERKKPKWKSLETPIRELFWSDIETKENMSDPKRNYIFALYCWSWTYISFGWIHLKCKLLKSLQYATSNHEYQPDRLQKFFLFQVSSLHIGGVGYLKICLPHKKPPKTIQSFLPLWYNWNIFSLSKCEEEAL